MHFDFTACTLNILPWSVWLGLVWCSIKGGELIRERKGSIIYIIGIKKLLGKLPWDFFFAYLVAREPYSLLRGNCIECPLSGQHCFKRESHRFASPLE